jgi:hypothetical protein
LSCRLTTEATKFTVWWCSGWMIACSLIFICTTMLSFSCASNSKVGIKYINCQMEFEDSWPKHALVFSYLHPTNYTEIKKSLQTKNVACMSLWIWFNCENEKQYLNRNFVMNLHHHLQLMSVGVIKHSNDDIFCLLSLISCCKFDSNF